MKENCTPLDTTRWTVQTPSKRTKSTISTHSYFTIGRRTLPLPPSTFSEPIVILQRTPSSTTDSNGPIIELQLPKPQDKESSFRSAPNRDPDYNPEPDNPTRYPWWQDVLGDDHRNAENFATAEDFWTNLFVNIAYCWWTNWWKAFDMFYVNILKILSSNFKLLVH